MSSIENYPSLESVVSDERFSGSDNNERKMLALQEWRNGLIEAGKSEGVEFSDEDLERIDDRVNEYAPSGNNPLTALKSFGLAAQNAPMEFAKRMKGIEAIAKDNRHLYGSKNELKEEGPELTISQKDIDSLQEKYGTGEEFKVELQKMVEQKNNARATWKAGSEGAKEMEASYQEAKGEHSAAGELLDEDLDYKGSKLIGGNGLNASTVAGAVPRVMSDMAAAAGLTVATGNPLTGALFFGGSSFSDSIDQQLDSHPDRSMINKMTRASAFASVSAVLESVGLGAAMKNPAIKTMSDKLLKTVAHTLSKYPRSSAILTAMLAEGGTEFAQSYAEVLSKDSESVGHFFEILADGDNFVNALKEGGVGTILGGTIRGTVEGVDAIRNREINKEIEKLNALEEEMPDDVLSAEELRKEEEAIGLTPTKPETTTPETQTPTEPTPEERAEKAKTTIVSPDNTTDYEATYEIIEREDLVRNEDELQNRDRQTKTSREQIDKMYSTFRGNLVVDGINSSSGTPIINSKGELVSGHGRSEVLDRIHKSREQFPEDEAKVQDYLNELSYKADRHGLSLEGFREPILVRRIDEAVIGENGVQDLIRKSQGSNTLAMGASNLATDDARLILENDLVDLIDPESDDIMSAANRDFVYKFIQDRNAADLLDSDGDVTPDAELRIKRALIASMFEDVPNAQKIVEKALVGDTGVKPILNALMVSSGKIVRNGKTNPEFDIRKDLGQAIKDIVAFHKASKKDKVLKDLPTYYQQEIPGAGEVRTEESMLLAEAMYEFKTAKSVKAFLDNYQSQVSLSAGDMLMGDTKNKKEVLTDAKELTRKRTSEAKKSASATSTPNSQKTTEPESTSTSSSVRPNQKGDAGGIDLLGSKESKVDYSHKPDKPLKNRKLGLEIASVEDTRLPNAYVALANMKVGESIPFRSGKLTVKSITAKQIKLEDESGKVSAYRPQTPRFENLLRDSEDLLNGHAHGVDSGDLRVAMLRDPAYKDHSLPEPRSILRPLLGGNAHNSTGDTLSKLDKANNLKSWGGKSKVVDENGKLLTLYHGTPYGRFSVQAKQQNNSVSKLKFKKSQLEESTASIERGIEAISKELGYDYAISETRLNSEMYDRMSEVKQSDDRVASLKSTIEKIESKDSHSKLDEMRLARAKKELANAGSTKKTPIVERYEELSAEIERRNALEEEIKSMPKNARVPESDIFRTRSDGSTDFGYLAEGAYFTMDKAEAENYAKHSGTYKPGLKKSPYVYEVHLNLENPWVKGQDPDIDNKVNQLANSYYNKESKGYSSDIEKLESLRASTLTKALVELGFDGQIGDYGAGLEYVAFDSNQVKSATANSGAYSKSDNDVFNSTGDAPGAVKRRDLRKEAPEIESGKLKGKRPSIFKMIDLVGMARKLGGILEVHKAIDNNPSIRGQFQAKKIRMRADMAIGEHLEDFDTESLMDRFKEEVGAKASSIDEAITWYEKNLAERLGEDITHTNKKGQISFYTDEPQFATKTFAHELGHFIDWLNRNTLTKTEPVLSKVVAFGKPFLKKAISIHNVSVLDKGLDFNSSDPDIQTEIEEIRADARKAAYRDAVSVHGPYAKADKKKFNDSHREFYGERVRNAFESLKILTEEEARSEITELSRWWRGDWKGTSPKNIKYRESTAEIYADALSVLFNAPDEFASRAPKFHAAFFAYLENKPEVLKVYADYLHEISSKDEIQRVRESIEEGFDAHDKQEIDKREKKEKDRKENSFRDHYDEFMRNYVNRNHLIEKLAGKKADIMARKIPYIDAMAAHFLSRPIALIKDLNKAGLRERDMSHYMIYTRVVKERRKMFNAGVDYETATGALARMKEELGADKFRKLEETARAYNTWRQRELIPRLKEADLLSENLENYIVNNESYAHFEVVFEEDSDKKGGYGVGLHEQKGTLKQLGSAFEATIIQDTKLLDKAIRNQARVAVAEGGVFPAAVKKKTANGVVFESVHDSEGHLFQYIKDGKIEAVIVPKGINDVFTYQSSNTGIEPLFRSLAKPYKMFWTEINPLFTLKNIRRDFSNIIMNIPAGGEHSTLSALTRFQRLELMGDYMKALSQTIRARKGEIAGEYADSLRGGSLIRNKTKKYWDGVHNEDTVLDGEFKTHGLVAIHKRRDALWKKILSGAFNGMAEINQIVEDTSKVAGRIHMTKPVRIDDVVAPYKGLGVDESEVINHINRELTGSPNFLHGGEKRGLYNSIFLYSNARLQGMRASYEALKNNPKDFTLKLAETWVARSIMAAAFYGALSELMGDEWEWFEEKVRKIPLGDLMFSGVIPLGEKEDGSTNYIFEPTDHASELVGALAFATMEKAITGNSHLGDIVARQTVGTTPAIGALFDPAKKAFGMDMPTNDFGAPRYDSDMWRGDMIDWIPDYLANSWNNMGGQFYKMQTAKTRSKKEGVVFFDNFLRTVYRSSDQGQADFLRHAVQTSKGDDASLESPVVGEMVNRVEDLGEGLRPVDVKREAAKAYISLVKGALKNEVSMGRFNDRKKFISKFEAIYLSKHGSAAERLIKRSSAKDREAMRKAW